MAAKKQTYTSKKSGSTGAPGMTKNLGANAPVGKPPFGSNTKRGKK